MKIHGKDSEEFVVRQAIKALLDEELTDFILVSKRTNIGIYYSNEIEGSLKLLKEAEKMQTRAAEHS